MKHNFDELTERRGTNSHKWNIATDSDIIPMWVADMDFKTAPAITHALQERVKHGIFGYVAVPDAFYNATINWFERRHHWTIERDWIIYTSGVVPAISAIIKALTKPGDKVLVQTPVFNCFFSSIRNNKCEIVESALIAKDDTFVIDFADLEEKTKDEAVKILLLCNPHNPACRVWTREELLKVGEICNRNHVVVVSDEIHNELTMPGYDYVPFASLAQEMLNNCITCISPSKSFNIAGLQVANIVTNNALWRKKIDKAINVNEVCDINPFGVEALIAAYNQGEEWLDELREYIWGNYQELKNFFEKNLPQFKVTKLEGTYLAWINISSSGKTSDRFAQEMLDKAKVWVNSGTIYGQKDGEGYIRINMACPRARMMEGLQRIAQVVNTLG